MAGTEGESEADAAPTGAIREIAAAVPVSPKLFSELDRKGKAVRIVAIAYAVLHLGAMLVGGAVPPIKRFFSPIVGFYGDGLRMSNAWGMFGKPPTSTHVAVEGVLADGRVVLLSTTDSHGRSWFERVRDARIRKIQGKLAEDGDRGRIGATFLDYYCREARREHPDVREVRARNIIHELRDDDGKVTRQASMSILMVRRCVDPSQGPMPRTVIPHVSPPAPRPQEGGGDM